MELPPLVADDSELVDLLPLNPRFFVPRLADKPQNPILDSLKLAEDLKRLPVASKFPRDNLSAKTPEEDLKFESDVWSIVDENKAAIKTNLRSWDTFRPSYPSAISPSPYLSEQDSLSFAAARHYVRPLLSDATTEVIYVDQRDLLSSLRVLVTGTSSVLHSWDPEAETFRVRNVEQGNIGLIVIVGKDEVVTASFLSRFMSIGTVSRRLEALTTHITNNDLGPTTHAFAHALSSILTFTRAMLTESGGERESQDALTAFWENCADIEQVLSAVAILCHREEQLTPDKYLHLSSDIDLLSEVYKQLASHFERSSPRIVTAVFAFILTTISQDYFQQIRTSVGYGITPTVPTTIREPPETLVPNEEEDPHFLKIPKQDHPCFVPNELQRNLQNAQRSLRLLQAAQPDHPQLLLAARQLSSLGWFWTESAILDAWERKEMEAQVIVEVPVVTPIFRNGPEYKRELVGLQIFDRDPGTHLKGASPLVQIQQFLASFPISLPSITPTLDILASLVLSPLAEYAATLSGALLNVFISRSSITSSVDLNFHSHLTLLRSFLLLTSHLFKSKVSAALFSDSDQYQWDSQTRDARSLALASRTPSGGDEHKPWPVGLALGLIERESWPPGGADLSFYLRTVIVDSTEKGRKQKWIGNDEVPVDHSPTAFEEAETRLGFAIRDLPTGKGRDRWLDPCSIEALDFLYMDYVPPAPLRILISPQIISKYQRIFTFNLRLMRVENVVRVLYRISRIRAKPLFPTFTPTNALFLHFRFLVQSFVSQFTSYIYDTAVRGHFNAFLHILESPKEMQRFSDVFSLAEYHSNVMDDVLTACLLRSGQRAAGDALRGCLETVLELGVLAGEIARDRIQEYEAKETLKELYNHFKRKMTRLLQALKSLTEKEVVEDSGCEGAHSIQHLLVKLDSGWWQ